MSNKLFLKIAGLVLAVSFLADTMTILSSADWNEDDGSDFGRTDEDAQVEDVESDETEESEYQSPVLLGSDGIHKRLR